MDIAQDKLELIGRIIRSDKKYSGNEDLFEDFLNETCQRSAAIIESLSDDAMLETYLKKVVTSSMIMVLKNSGRLRRSSGGYVPSQEMSLSPEPTKEPENTIDYSSIHISYSTLKIPESPEELAIQKEMLEFVAESIKKIDNDNPNKNFLDIFSMRYDQGMTQREIAESLHLSQSEVSKRLFQLITKVKDILEQ